MIVPVSDEQLKAIRNTCPRSQAENDQDLAIIKHWLNKQPHLPKTSEYNIQYNAYAYFNRDRVRRSSVNRLIKRGVDLTRVLVDYNNDNDNH